MVSHNSDKNKWLESDWVNSLNKLRKDRRDSAALKADISPEMQKKEKSFWQRRMRNMRLGASPALKREVYQHYLKQWEKEKNETMKEVDAPAEVLLSNRWTVEADRILLRSKVEGDEERVLFYKKAGERPIPLNEEQQIDLENSDTPPELVQLTIVHPHLDPNKKLCVIDEDEFINKIKKELKPQLEDLLHGMIKNMLLTNYDIMLSCIQKELQEELPNVMDELLQNHLKAQLQR